MQIAGLMKLTTLDYPGETAATIFTPGCNFKCPFCHNTDLVNHTTGENYTEDQIISYLKTREHIIDAICITGGEPTLQGDKLYDFVKKVAGQTGVKIKIDTNGTNPQLLEKLIDSGCIDYVAMDIKAPFETYSDMSGVRKFDDELLYNINMKLSIDLLRNTDKVDYEFRTTVIGNYHDASKIERMCESIKGAKQYYLQAYKDSGNILNKEKGFKSPTKEQMNAFKYIAENYIPIVGIRGI